jgi:hypothetical protein
MKDNARKALLAVICTAMCASSAHAVFFDLRDNVTLEPIDEVVSFNYPVGGITATLTAVVGPPANAGVLNSTLSGFGVNATGSGDVTDMLDGVNGIEEVDITFNQNVLFTQLTVSSFGGTDAGEVIIAGGSPISITSTGLQDVPDTSVLTGQSVVVRYVAGNGFSFDSFVATPEPGTVLLLAIGGLALLRRR